MFSGVPYCWKPNHNPFQGVPEVTRLDASSGTETFFKLCIFLKLGFAKLQILQIILKFSNVFFDSQKYLKNYALNISRFSLVDFSVIFFGLRKNFVIICFFEVRLVWEDIFPKGTGNFPPLAPPILKKENKIFELLHN